MTVKDMATARLLYRKFLPCHRAVFFNSGVLLAGSKDQEEVKMRYVVTVQGMLKSGNEKESKWFTTRLCRKCRRSAGRWAARLIKLI